MPSNSAANKLVSCWILECENAFTVLNGDLLDLSIMDSVGDVYGAEFQPRDQLWRVRDVFRPLAQEGRILGVTSGNHEERIYKKTGIDVMEWLADYWGVRERYDPDGVLLKIRFGKRPNGKPQVYTAYFTHGTGGGRTKGGKINKLDAMKDIVLADVYAIGHVHWMTAYQDVYYIPDLRNNTLTTKKRTYVCSGAYLDYGGYG